MTIKLTPTQLRSIIKKETRKHLKEARDANSTTVRLQAILREVDDKLLDASELCEEDLGKLGKYEAQVGKIQRDLQELLSDLGADSESEWYGPQG